MRIRTVKPEFWQSETIASLPRDLRLFAVGLLNWADDDGYFRSHPALIAGALFPFDGDGRDFVSRGLSALADIGYLKLFNGGIGQIVHFRDHQVINKPIKSKLSGLAKNEIRAAPDTTPVVLPESSHTTPVVLPESSHTEWNGMEVERNGMEVEAEKESAPPTAKHPPPSSTQVSGAAFFAWTQDLRAIEFGFVREKPPRGGLNAWFNRAMLEVGGDLERLKAGFVAFSGDQYWRPRKAPWAGWIDQWERFVPSRASEPSPSAQAACAVHGCSKSANGVVWGKRLCASHHAAWTETEIRSEAEMASWVRAQTSPGAGLPPPQFNEQQYPRGEVAA